MTGNSDVDEAIIDVCSELTVLGVSNDNIYRVLDERGIRIRDIVESDELNADRKLELVLILDKE